MKKYFRCKVESMMVHYYGTGTAVSYIFEDELYELTSSENIEDNKTQYVWFKEKDNISYPCYLEKDVFDLVMEKVED